MNPRSCDLGLKLLPAVRPLLWYGLGVYAVLGQGLPAIGRLALALGLALAFWWPAPASQRRWLWLLAAGSLQGFLPLWSLPGSYLRQLPVPECHFHLRGEVVEVLAPDRLELALEEGAAGSQPLNSCRGRILLVHDPAQAFSAGERLEADGALLVPAPAEFPGGYSEALALAQAGIRHRLEAVRIRSLGPAPVFHWRLWRERWKRWLELRLRQRVQDPELASILAAMTLGTHLEITPETRKTFLLSGSIHILSISGLHIGALAVMLLWLFRGACLPWRQAHWMAIAGVGAYVLLSGASAPAVRSWLMAGAWSVGRIHYRCHSSFNSVAAAALLMLAANPWLLFDNGFQFSFVTVATLVFAWDFLDQAWEVCQERRLWIPGRYRPSGRFRRWAFMLGGTAAGAWMAGIGLTAWYNQMFLPGSPAVNLLVPPLSAPLLGGAFLKILLADIPLVDGILAAALARTLEALVAVCELGSRQLPVVFLASPPLMLAMGYYAALAGLAIARRRRWFVAGLLACGAAVCWPPAAPHPGSAWLVSGGEGRTPAFCVAGPGGDHLAILPPDAVMARRLRQALAAAGLAPPAASMLSGGRDGRVPAALLPAGGADAPGALFGLPSGRSGNWRLSQQGGRIRSWRWRHGDGLAVECRQSPSGIWTLEIGSLHLEQRPGPIPGHQFSQPQPAATDARRQEAPQSGSAAPADRMAHPVRPIPAS